jgi:hypothetical protein
MEKKKYIAPRVEIIPLPQKVRILAGSDLGMGGTPVPSVPGPDPNPFVF